ncbi:MAG TPA: DUF4156 domain-containing protein [Gammaproteobacteria bacterium]
MKRIIILSAAALSLQACTWIKLTPEGEQARVLSAADVTNCKKLGATTVSMATKVGIVPLNQKKVAEELKLLARNSAAEMQGDSVVAVGEPKEGQQTFDVYRCINP